MDEAVLHAKRQMRIGADPDYDLAVRELRRPALRAPGAARPSSGPGLDLIEHFLDTGVVTGQPGHPLLHGRLPGALSGRADGHERSPYLEWLKRGHGARERSRIPPRPSRDGAPARARAGGRRPAGRPAHRIWSSGCGPASWARWWPGRRARAADRRAGFGSAPAPAAFRAPAGARADRRDPCRARDGRLPSGAAGAGHQPAAVGGGSADGGPSRLMPWPRGSAPEEVVVVYTDEAGPRGGSVPRRRTRDRLRRARGGTWSPRTRRPRWWSCSAHSRRRDRQHQLGTLYRAVQTRPALDRLGAALPAASSATSRSRPGPGRAGASATSTACSSRWPA